MENIAVVTKLIDKNNWRNEFIEKMFMKDKIEGAPTLVNESFASKQVLYLRSSIFSHESFFNLTPSPAGKVFINNSVSDSKCCPIYM